MVAIHYIMGASDVTPFESRPLHTLHSMLWPPRKPHISVPQRNGAGEQQEAAAMMLPSAGGI